MMLTPTVLSRLAAGPGAAALLALRGWNSGTQLRLASSDYLVLIALPVAWYRWQRIPAVAARGAA